jgi:hypothetical protein
MSIAVFKPLLTAAGEGEKVWDRLVQKVVEEAELAEHTAAGWLTDANEALTAADLAQTEQDNAALQAQIDAATQKLDGRTKAGREAKAQAEQAPQ